MATAQSNQYLLAADNPSACLTLLRSNPALASQQDGSGYSLVHAATAYNQHELLRALLTEFHVSVDLKDEDGETALFVVETIECAKILVEEFHVDILVRGTEGKTAGEKIAEEGDFHEVAVYLRVKELEAGIPQVNGVSEATTNGHPWPPALPEGVRVDIGTMAPEDVGEAVDSEFRRTIEELASREDFQSEAGQALLRELITEAIGGDIAQERDIRRRTG